MSPTLSEVSVDESWEGKKIHHQQNIFGERSFDRDSEGSLTTPFKYASSYKKVQERIELAMRQTHKPDLVLSTRVLLYVIKMQPTKPLSRSPTLLTVDFPANKHQMFDYFKMYLDCSKCQEDDGGTGDDQDLRRFRKKVKKRLRLGDGFRVYN